MKILVINSGSSSIKFKLFDMNNEETLCKGLIERIGERNSYSEAINNKNGKKEVCHLQVVNHGFGIDILNQLLKQIGAFKSISELDGVGHRVVQGADLFTSSVLINDKVMRQIESLIPLAPLHNPAHLAGMRETLRLNPETPNVAVFDTVFHQTMPQYAYMYPLPLEFYEKYKVRRYGAHGTSHQYASKEAAKLLDIDYEDFSCISLHIGSGSSISAIKNGKCIDTSMGLTPLEGLMMGTRSGDIDPAIIPFLMKNAGLNEEEIDEMLNKKSGLLAIAGTNDMRELETQMYDGSKSAKLALDMFVLRIIKYIGAYMAEIGKVDALIFTAGIGENDPIIRQAICDRLEGLHIEISKESNFKNLHNPRLINSTHSKVKVAVIPANEELAIARETLKIINQLKNKD